MSQTGANFEVILIYRLKTIYLALENNKEWFDEK